MNTLPRRRRAGTTWWCLLAIAIGVTAGSAQVFDKPLTDADLEKLLPLLAAEAVDQSRRDEQAERDAAAERARQAARSALVREIAGSQVDPLAWLRQKTPHTVVPSTARYEAACSRAVSQQAGNVAAVFTFGVAAPDSWIAVARGSSGPPPTPAGAATRPRAAAAESVAPQTRSFYSARGFKPQGEQAAFAWGFLSPDGLITATVHGVNPHHALPACQALASGPAITLDAAPKAFGPSAPAGRRAGALREALTKAGLDDVEYQSLRFQAIQARNDARNPSSFEVERPVGVIAGDAAAREKAVRTQNVAWYWRFAAKLDPLLDRLIR
jgi:hypothetical protein